MSTTFTPNLNLGKPQVNVDTDWPTQLNSDMDKVDAHDHSGSASKGLLVAHPQINGRLTFVSATQIKFSPYQGNRLFIKKSGVWQTVTIAAAGITAANTGISIDGVGGSNLAANTTYFVYLFDNAGTTTVDFSTTGHAPDSTTGVEIKSGVDTRVLIGMVRTNASSQFEDDNALRGVLSYFNRREIAIANGFTATRTSTTGSYAEVHSEIRANFLTWGDEAVIAAIQGEVSNSGAASSYTAIGFDGATSEDGHSVATGTSVGGVAVTAARTLSEGFHFATLLGVTGGGTGTYAGSAALGSRTSLVAKIRG